MQQQQVDVGSIVPSTRDLLQVIATRRKSMALVGLLGDERPAEEAARLHELNVSAFAAMEPGPAMALVARATKTVPVLSLQPAADREAFLRARYFGADGVCIDASVPLEEWDKAAKGARTTRMLPLALASDAAGVEAAVKAGARVLVLRVPSAAEAVALAAAVPKSLTLVADVAGVDAAGLRSLMGHVDAAVVPASVHADKAFAELVAEVDP
jgi:indole-3-glycerol phosphate synthase